MLNDIPILERQVDININTNSNSNNDDIYNDSKQYLIDPIHELIKRDTSNKKYSLKFSKSNVLTTESTITPTSTSTSTLIPTSLTDDDLVTVYTHVSDSRSNTFSIDLIIPTITTNDLPFTFSGISLNSTIPVSTNSCNSYPLSINNSTNTNSYRGYSTSKLSSIYSSVSTYMDPILSTSTSTSKSRAKSKSKSKSKSTSKTSSKSISKFVPKTSSSSITSSVSSSVLSSASFTSLTSSHLKTTTTVTEYLEDITYTQVYVITGSKYTITTSLLATTALYVDSLSSTYAISPPAITTDINSLRSRTDFGSLFKHGLSKGSIAGIAVGSILGFLLILSILLFFLLRKRKNNIFINKLFSNKHDNFNDTSYIHDNSNDSDDDDYNDSTNNTNFDYSRSLSPIDPIGPIIPPNSQNRIPSIPPIPNRSNKPAIAPIISTLSNSPDIDSNALILPETPINPTNPNNVLTTSNKDQNKKVSNINTNNDQGDDDQNIDNDDDFDLSLFDMKSTLNAINASTEVNHHLMPPVPPARKSLSSNRIDKMNHKVSTLSLLSPPQLPTDRIMGVLYESPNEQCNWDEFEGAKNHGSMYDSTDGSPIDSVFGPFEPKGKNKNYKSHYMEQLNSNGDYDDNSKNNLLDSNRVRSGSGAKRYEHLANNVNIIKHELEKERLASPLSITDDKIDVDNHNDKEFNFDFNSPLGKPSVKVTPPPIPKPRKNINNDVSNKFS